MAFFVLKYSPEFQGHNCVFLPILAYYFHRRSLGCVFAGVVIVENFHAQVAARCKVRICGRLLSGIACSNPAGVIDVYLFSLLSFVTKRSLRRADHSSRGALPSVVYLSVVVKSQP